MAVVLNCQNDVMAHAESAFNVHKAQAPLERVEV